MIEVKDLYKTYGEVNAVNGISFQVKEGELFAFLGLNGAGKSTTIHIICGTLQKNSGSVFVDGMDIEKERMKIKSEIGIVFQNSVLDRKLTVYENLKTKAELYGVRGKEFQTRFAELNELFDLKPILKRTLEKLSGGQRRKVDIVRALLHNPKILILDEPTTGLDPQTRLMVWRCLDKFRKEKKLTIFLTTHYMEEAAEAENVVIIDQGKIVAADTPNGLKNAYAKDFIRFYDKTKEVEEMLKKEQLKKTEKEGCIEIEVDNAAQAKQLIYEYPNAFEDFEIIKGKMDDVFLKVTGKELTGGGENE